MAPSLPWSGRHEGVMERFRGGVSKADMVFLCVETPTRREGEGAGMAAGTGYLDKAITDLAKWAKEGFIVILKNTVSVGTPGRVKEMVSLPQDMLQPQFIF